MLADSTKYELLVVISGVSCGFIGFMGLLIIYYKQAFIGVNVEWMVYVWLFVNVYLFSCRQMIPIRQNIIYDMLRFSLIAHNVT